MHGCDVLNKRGFARPLRAIEAHPSTGYVNNYVRKKNMHLVEPAGLVQW